MRRRQAVSLAASIAVAGSVLTIPALATPALADTGWTSLSQNPADNGYPRTITYDLPSMARFGPTLQAVWRAQDAVTGESYWTAAVDTTGRRTVVPQRIGVLTQWAGLQESPRLLTYGSQRMLVFSGQQTTASRNDYSRGAAYYALGPSAVTWGLGSGSLSNTTSAYPAEGFDALLADGTPIWAGNPAGSDGLTWHVGVSAEIPAPDGTDGRWRCRECRASDAALARDPVTGEVMAAVYSDSTLASEEGIWVGAIAPREGSFVRAPGSYAVRGGTADSLPPEQRVALVGRAGGGVFAAYRSGYPEPASSIVLWRVGALAGVPVPGSAGARTVALAAAPDGRLWIAWTTNTSRRVKVVRTDPTATRFGTVRTLPAPAGYAQLWHTVADAGIGSLDLVVTAQNGNGAINVFHRGVLPGLGLTTRASVVSAGTRVVTSVTDAGTPVAGARVTVAGTSVRTGPTGRAVITVRGSALRTVDVVARAPGYARSAQRVSVTPAS